MKNKILPRIKEFLKTNKKLLLVTLAVIIFFVPFMIVPGFEKLVAATAMLMGVVSFTVIWLCACGYLGGLALEKILRILEVENIENKNNC